MSFDWGGFTGSIVGVIGAYGIAVYQMHKQKKQQEPYINKKKYEFISQLFMILRVIRTEFAIENSSFSKLSEDAVRFSSELRDLIPGAIETDPEILNAVYCTATGLMNIHEKYQSVERTIGNLGKYKQELLELINETQIQCRMLSSEILMKNGATWNE